jgi:hypothetical protein
MAIRDNGNRGHVFSTPTLNTASDDARHEASRDVAPVRVEQRPWLMAQILKRQLAPCELAFVVHTLVDHPAECTEWMNRLKPAGGFSSEEEVARFMVRVAAAVHGRGQA